MTSIEPELWVGRPAAAVDFYRRAFGAEVIHLVGDGDDIVAQLAVGPARFWVAGTGTTRLDPHVAKGATGRTLLVVAYPEAVVAASVAAGAEVTSVVSDEHGWRLGRVVDPFGHEWEIGHPAGTWPGPGPRDDHPFAALAGTWRGAGRGQYPTIGDFAYTEELVIGPVPGRPLAHWRSTTRDAATQEPRHAESGFLRATAGGLELAIAHGFGVVETAAGSFDGAVLACRSTGLVGTASAKRVDEVERRYVIAADDIHYEIAMAAVGVPLTHHLRAELHRS